MSRNNGPFRRFTGDLVGVIRGIGEVAAALVETLTVVIVALISGIGDVVAAVWLLLGRGARGGSDAAREVSEGAVGTTTRTADRTARVTTLASRTVGGALGALAVGSARGSIKLVTEAVELVAGGGREVIREALPRLRPADQADVIDHLDAADREAVLREIPPRQLAAMLPYFEPGQLRTAAAALPPERFARVLDVAPPDDATDALRALRPADAQAVMTRMRRPERLEALLGLETQTAGTLMTSEVVRLAPSITAGQAGDHLRAVAQRTDDLTFAYVIDEADALLGRVSWHDLVTAPPNTRLETLMSTPPLVVPVDTPESEVLRLATRYRVRAAPVVDGDGKLLGAVLNRDLFEVAEREATGDMYRIVGLTESEELSGPISLSIRRRLPWLSVNLATAFIAAATVAAFEDTLARVAVLAAFLPIVAGQGGNAGSQTLTLVVREMALRDLGRGAARNLIRREALVGLGNGLAIGVIVGILAWVWQGNVWFGIILGVAMVGNMVAAGIAGVLVPVGLKTMRADPALASTIFVTTVTDVLGFLFFLGLAALLITRLT